MKKYTQVLYWFYKLSWKKIIGTATFLLIITILPTALKVAQNPTRTRSEAALLPQPQSITDKFEVPTGPPVIYLVDHFFGKPGDAVLIHGDNLGGLHKNSWVSLAGQKIAVENLVGWSGNYIEFKVPNGARSGKIEISVLGKRTVSPGIFLVTNENTEAELRLVDGYLKAKKIAGGQELLIWLLVMKGEEKVKLTPASGVLMTSREFELPIGKIYEAKLKIKAQVANQSITSLVNLLKIQKSKEMLVGIARGELSNGKGGLLPLQVHPLYVSF